MCKYVIVGKRGSGKKQVLDEFVKNGLKPLVKYTTKQNSKDGKNVTKTVFNKMVEDMKFIYTSKVKNQWWGLTQNGIENCDVAILSFDELEVIKNWFPSLVRDTSIIFLDIPDGVRRKNLKHRYSGDKMDEQIKHILYEDNRLFRNFNNFDIVFNNIDEALKVINRFTHRTEGE